jgi:hypothetical protein
MQLTASSPGMRMILLEEDDDEEEDKVDSKLND